MQTYATDPPKRLHECQGCEAWFPQTFIRAAAGRMYIQRSSVQLGNAHTYQRRHDCRTKAVLSVNQRKHRSLRPTDSLPGGDACSHHALVHFGSRLSKKAVMPSFWSWVANVDWKSARSYRTPLLSGIS
jgi:hypothetical protein